MIVGIGTDHVEIAEFEELIAADTTGFVGRVFTESEIACARASDSPGQRLAARFAAKEATMKALGTGWTDDVDWKNIEVVNDASGQPQIRLVGRVAELAVAIHAQRLLVSISHTKHLAVAQVIAEDS